MNLPCGYGQRIFLLLVGVLTGVYYICSVEYVKYIASTGTVPRNKTGASIKYILYWGPSSKNLYYGWGEGSTPFRHCHFKNCFATSNRKLLQLQEFDALIFPRTYSEAKHGVPWIRSPHQRYILANGEAPSNEWHDFQKLNYFFNWTMTYRYDSELVSRHGQFTNKTTKYHSLSTEFLKAKTKLAAWFVSHCKTSSKREILVSELQKHIQVDVYGACGNLTCAKIKGRYVSSPKCYTMLDREYKFYLSFENSYCKDYTTEKLYSILRLNVVPVVYGGDNYHRETPPYSVINVEDFETAEDLASYLKYLDNHPKAYLKYFEWKKHYYIDMHGKVTCLLCQKLNNPAEPNSVYTDLETWFWGLKRSICKTGRWLPKIVSSLIPT